MLLRVVGGNILAKIIWCKMANIDHDRGIFALLSMLLIFTLGRFAVMILQDFLIFMFECTCAILLLYK